MSSLTDAFQGDILDPACSLDGPSVHLLQPEDAKKWDEYAWAGLMYVSAVLNLVLALTLDPVSWSMAISVWGIASKVALFVIQYAAMRGIARRRALSHPAAR